MTREQIEAKLAEIGAMRPKDEERPVYGCFECRDRGFTLYDADTKYGYRTTFSEPCESCELGTLIRNRIHNETQGGTTRPIFRNKQNSTRFPSIREI